MKQRKALHLDEVVGYATAFDVIAICIFGIVLIVGIVLIAQAVDASTARIHFNDAAVQQVIPFYGGRDIVAEAQGAVETFRCYADRPNYELCKALRAGMQVSLEGRPVPSDADDPDIVDMIALTVYFDAAELPPDGGDQDG